MNIDVPQNEFNKLLKRPLRFNNITNQRFGRWAVIQFIGIKNKRYYWECLCDCGVIKIIDSGRLKNGKSLSCGCLAKELTSKRQSETVTHNMTYTPIYKLWCGMKERCLNHNARNYHKYGGRGITVCDSWLKFENFYQDMGPRPDGMSLDRINNDLLIDSYSKDNCRWSTHKEQNRHTRLSAKSIDYDLHKYWRNRLSDHISNVIRLNYKSSSILEFHMGCSLDQFRSYIESLFTKDMSWDNNGNGNGTWQLDHIVGCNNFDHAIEEDRLKCWNYKNLRPMWYEDHIKKSRLRISEI